nr:MAG TPA: hypothetical protein [Caudoviricetes sp.]
MTILEQNRKLLMFILKGRRVILNGMIEEEGYYDIVIRKRCIR